MKKKTLTWFICLMMIMSVIPASALENEAEIQILKSERYNFGGTGTAEDPFRISSVEDLERLRDCVDAGITYKDYYFVQTEDLYFHDGQNWNPIGNQNENMSFSGTYDGQGHTISNIYCDDIHAGLFSRLSGVVRNLGIESGLFTGSYVGSITSHGSSSAKIINCYNKASVSATGRAGGIADNLGTGSVEYCLNLGSVASESGVVGGIISYDAGALVNCYALDLPLTTYSYTGTVKDSEVISKEEINREWMELIGVSLFEYSSEELEEQARWIHYLTAEGDEIVFGDEDYRPALVQEKLNMQLAARYGVIGILSVLVVAFLIVGLVKYRKPKDVANNEERKVTEPEETEKNSEKIGFAGIVWVLVFVVIGTSVANWTLYLKRADGVTNLKDYYVQPEDTVDVLLLGSSKVGVNLDVETLWRNYGISGYALWGSIQPFWNSYYYLKEAIKENPPQMAVLDVNAATQEIKYSDEGRQYANTYGMKLSLDKLEAIQVSAPQERWTELLLGMPIYHTRYTELGEIDFQRYPWSSSERVNNKGNTTQYGSAGLTGYGDASRITSVKLMEEKQEVYLRKIIELCAAEDIPLVLIATPSFNVGGVQPYLNYIQMIADEYGVPFINYNLIAVENGLTDEMFYDSGHVNTEGARILTDYLGSYLSANYTLEDHRGDEAYQSWEAFSHNAENNYLCQITEVGDYIKELARNDRTVAFVKWGKVDQEDSAALNEALMAMGLDTEFLYGGDNVCYVLDSTLTPDAVRAYSIETDQDFMIDDEVLEIQVNGERMIRYAGKDVCAVTSGVVCVVYDSYTKTIVDTQVLY